LSNGNIILAISLFVFFLVRGPATFLFDSLTTTLGSYNQKLPQVSFRLALFDEGGNDWIQGWTVFCWAWWSAWSPFVGTFIARVSRGRTIREFVFGVLAVPTLFCALWFTMFGGTGISMDLFDGG